MLLNLLSGDFTVEDIPLLLLRIPIILIALTVHETSHGRVALWMGDTTARDRGRLSLNPLRHLDLFGALAMLIVGFGWAKPVPIDARKFKNPKAGMALSSLAGPVSNVLLSFFGLVCMRIIYIFLPSTSGLSDFSFYLVRYTLMFFYMFAIMNLALAIFNFLPMPPLDGSRILFAFLPDKAYFGIMKYERYIAAVIMILLLFGVLDKPMQFLLNGALGGMESLLGLTQYLN